MVVECMKEKECVARRAASLISPSLTMKIYVHLDEDSATIPPHTLKIDDASSLTIANLIDQFSTAYVSKVSSSHAMQTAAADAFCSTAKAACPPPRRCN